MTDNNANTPATPVPATPVTPATTNTPAQLNLNVTATNPTPPAVVEPKIEVPQYLKDRLEQKARAVLKDAGFKAPKGQSIDESVKQAKEKYESQKARRQAAEEERDKAAAEAASMKGQLAAIKMVADAEFANLTDEQKKFVKDAAGSDPVQQLQQISALRAFAGKPPVTTPAPTPPAATPPAAPVAPVTATPATPVPTPAPNAAAAALAAQPPTSAVPLATPANTAPAAGTPTPPNPSAPEDPKATYQALLATNPYLARQYLLNNRFEIFPDRTFVQVADQKK